MAEIYEKYGYLTEDTIRVTGDETIGIIGGADGPTTVFVAGVTG